RHDRAVVAALVPVPDLGLPDCSDDKDPDCGICGSSGFALRLSRDGNVPKMAAVLIAAEIFRKYSKYLLTL
ncbi:MAG: hypothetical protein IK116_06460, partial [Firmicutes bacterium]|nr:hypothetical protein [Bacillota bacterium]